MSTVDELVASGQTDLGLRLVEQVTFLGIDVLVIVILDVVTSKDAELMRIVPCVLITQHSVTRMVLSAVVVRVDLVACAGSPVVGQCHTAAPEVPSAYRTTALHVVTVGEVEGIIHIQGEARQESDGCTYRSTCVVTLVAVHVCSSGFCHRITERMSLIGAVRHDCRPAVEVIQGIVTCRIEVERFGKISAGV